MESFSYQNGNSNKEHDFNRLSQIIGDSIQKISQNVSSMQRMVNQIGTNQDSPDIRTQLHKIQHYTQDLVKDTNGYLKDLQAVPASFLQTEQRQRKMQRERLTDEFTSVLNLFQAAQRSAAAKEKEQINKAKVQAFGDPFISNKNDQQLIELQDTNVSRQQQMLKEEAELRLLQEQEQSVRQLENDIKDVNEIFKELGAMVHEQGEIVDSIEASVEHTTHSVSQGVSQLREASTYKNKIRRKKLIIALIAAVILTVIILIIFYSTN